MEFLDKLNNIIDYHIKEATGFMIQTTVLGHEYDEGLNENFDIGFNVFTISSDYYYRENFHSDIIKALLDPQEKHKEGSKYLMSFIDLLNAASFNLRLDKNDFQSSVVERDPKNIDILIFDPISKKAIIIENKINNAIDQHRQLPNYYHAVSKEYDVVAIVYLTSNNAKKPRKTEWTYDEIKIINPILIIVPAYEKTCINLYENWIIPSIAISSNTESTYLLQQYGNLIKYISIKYMDIIILEKFYETLKESNNLKTSISVRNMLSEIPEYLAIRIEDKYKNNCFPFKNVWRHHRTDTVFEAFEMENLYLKMDIWCSERGYKVYFWNPNNIQYDIKENLSQLLFVQFTEYDNGKKNSVVKEFTFFEENDLFHFIDNVILLL